MAAPRESSLPVRAVLLDIEGTTTSTDFVYQTLFPYFRQHVGEFLKRHEADISVLSDVKALREEAVADITKDKQLNAPHGKPSACDSDLDSSFIVAYLKWLMDRDRKSTALKSLQGKVWEEGYKKGELRGHVYPDVLPAFRRWREMGITIAIFSSGSVLAQRLLFAQTVKGDLSSYIHHYFDTTTGPKSDSRSYATISEELKLPLGSILFISDSVSELDAARLAGMNTRLCARSEPPAEDHGHDVIVSFDEVLASAKLPRGA